MSVSITRLLLATVTSAALHAQVVPVPPPAPPAGPVVIESDRILDGRGAALGHLSIIIERGKIVWSGTAVDNPTYDLRGYTVLPGWIDTHVHIGSHFTRDGRIATETEPPEE